MRIRVCIFLREGRKHFEAQWPDPVTSLKKTRTTGTSVRREAERFAARLEAELAAGKPQNTERVTWEQFRKRYMAEAVPAMAPTTKGKVTSTFNLVEKHINPARLVALKAPQLSQLSTAMRDAGRAEATIKSTLGTLRAALNWAHRQGLLDHVPGFEMPRRVSGMKGRPISRAEFELMLAAARQEPDGQSWADMLEGLWCSGLRLGEAIALHWTDDRELRVDLSGRRPMFRIRADAEKGNKDRLLPMVPEFYAFLEKIPEERRTGYVFQPLKGGERVQLDCASRMISGFGETAEIKVAESQDGKVKFASAHDLRRSFGFRWARKVMPVVLMELMRHESVNTTMQYYVGRNAEATADEIWLADSNANANNAVPDRDHGNRESA